MKNRNKPTLAGLALAMLVFLSPNILASNTAFASGASRGSEAVGFLAGDFNARVTQSDFNGFSFTKGNFSGVEFANFDFAKGGSASFGFARINFKETDFKDAFILNNRNAMRGINARKVNRNVFAFAGRSAVDAFNRDGFFGCDFVSF